MLAATFMCSISCIQRTFIGQSQHGGAARWRPDTEAAVSSNHNILGFSAWHDMVQGLHHKQQHDPLAVDDLDNLQLPPGDPKLSGGAVHDDDPPPHLKK